MIWKDIFGKTRIHRDGCRRLFGSKRRGNCTCPKQLAFGTVDSLIGKLCSIFSAAGRSGDDSSLPGYGNPAASKLVKEYLAAVRIEQLEFRRPFLKTPENISGVCLRSRKVFLRTTESLPELSPDIFGLVFGSAIFIDDSRMPVQSTSKTSAVMLRCI